MIDDSRVLFVPIFLLVTSQFMFWTYKSWCLCVVVGGAWWPMLALYSTLCYWFADNCLGPYCRLPKKLLGEFLSAACCFLYLARDSCRLLARIPAKLLTWPECVVVLMVLCTIGNPWNHWKHSENLIIYKASHRHMSFSSIFSILLEAKAWSADGMLAAVHKVISIQLYALNINFVSLMTMISTLATFLFEKTKWYPTNYTRGESYSMKQ